MAGDDHSYHPKDTIKSTINNALTFGGLGTFIAAAQNTLTKQNVGALGTFRVYGGTIGTFTAAGAFYAFTHASTANLREKDDSWSKAVGGFFAGSVLGLRNRSLPHTLGYGSGLAVILAVFDYTGGSLRGWKKDETEDEVSRKEELRKTRRKPIEQTLAELGEGRGIYPEGYDQRRRERLKEKYGLDLEGVPSAHSR
ncbi:hypothetical protein EJ05DRAFT_510980 [Pseudovirgaria hyperparasitica]|uniref:NADH-ubiquinone oxidoreductase 213 kDa subunit n=1 Tax=Pseudovirgaria hyperparasitica TaxID=470096 RepID=A0A6A6W8E1_9PEZI|nr:uncharacterized protein EJ05DRAFT_510980 [Pseudovirgaria hyperparasitica]KAF2758156.1 hypothetical protein EJ05DRAFT_510980 [Pseudovirgaria hyperparasitica]